MKHIIIALFLVSYASSQVLPDCDPNNVSWHHHPWYCDRYFLCFWGKLNQRFCAPGLHYNRRTTQCMSPGLANCEIDTGLNCPATDDPNKLIFLSDFKDCASYFLCFNGNPISRSCGPEFWWDVNKNWCTTAENVTCDPRAPNKPQKVTPARVSNTFDCPRNIGKSRHAHSQFCWKYFICDDGISFLHECAEGQLFDTNTTECSNAINVLCNLGTSTERK